MVEVQEQGSSALGHIACERGAGAEAVVAAGGVAAVVGGMQAHVGVAAVQQERVLALARIAGIREPGLAWQREAVVAVAALVRTHP